MRLQFDGKLEKSGYPVLSRSAAIAEVRRWVQLKQVDERSYVVAVAGIPITRVMPYVDALKCCTQARTLDALELMGIPEKEAARLARMYCVGSFASRVEQAEQTWLRRKARKRS